MTEKIACPFCGGEATIQKQDPYPYSYDRWFVICECSATGPNDGKKKDVVAAWNRRSN